MIVDLLIGREGAALDEADAPPMEKNSIVTFENRKSVKKLKGFSTVTKFRETFDKK